MSDMTSATNGSVTEQMAEWIVKVDDADVPAVAVERVRNLVLDSLGNQFAGMSVSTGRLLSEWVRAQGGAPVCTVTARDFKTTPAFATLVNGAASHALENDDIATFSSHPNSPLTAASIALGEKLGCSGREVVTAWVIGWEITAQTMKVCLGPRGNELINRGWFNQGFQETLGVAALAARLLKLDVDQTRMALGHAASAMAGMMKNRGTDTKGFSAGSAAMHGVIAAELAAMGFTADRDILDGELGVARLLGLENGDPEKMLDGLGSWDLATRGSTIRLHACCGAAHWSMDALQQILRDRPVAPDEIEAIDVEIPEFLTDMVPFHAPRTGTRGEVQPRVRRRRDRARRARRHPAVHRRRARAAGRAGVDEAGAHHPDERTACRAASSSRSRTVSNSKQPRAEPMAIPPIPSPKRRSSGSSTSAPGNRQRPRSRTGSSSSAPGSSCSRTFASSRDANRRGGDRA